MSIRAPSPLFDDLEPVITFSTNEIIQERLLRLITAGKLQPGDKLPSQRILAERLGVSQVPLREALRSLEALGVLEAKVGSGWYVKDYSFDGIAKALAPRLNLSERSVTDLDEIRTHLECAFLPEAMRTLTPERKQAVEDALHEMDRLASDPSQTPAFAEQDRIFHVTLFAGVSNRLFIELMEMFWVLRGYLSVWIESDATGDGDALEMRRRDMVEAAEKHRLFFEALCAGDVERARALRRRRLGGPAYRNFREE